MSDAVVIALIISTMSLVGVIFTGIISIIVAIQTGKKVGQTHDLVNSRMTEFMDTLKAQSATKVDMAHLQGVAAGEQAQRDRSAPSA